ncbi:hypothetical protein D0T84_21265 [Dysgonomonas sp. 521]|uniref:winged helix-turn-helix domain-containing protein n=1 Tax=Dysgonomonas sp. 521 TaxID=2302932 RepID=UPI0013D79F67|nr:winged helix-turn-helix domain-containing protein [Dysgonomonas sp. 521]NDV97407.1 hypothetical protein [Dysgonomonas sp. 521]
MLKKIISSDSVFIHQLLSSNGVLKIEQLMDMTGYREMYIYLVLGWLSKEDNICYLEKEDGLYIKFR